MWCYTNCVHALMLEGSPKLKMQRPSSSASIRLQWSGQVKMIHRQQLYCSPVVEDKVMIRISESELPFKKKKREKRNLRYPSMFNGSQLFFFLLIFSFFFFPFLRGVNGLAWGPKGWVFGKEAGNKWKTTSQVCI